MPDASLPLYPAERITTAQSAIALAGLDALLLTPGPDLRYLTGYDAMPLERLTCLVVPAAGPATLILPTLEVAAAQESPAAAWGLPIVAWPETADPYELVATTLVEDLGRSPKRVGLDDHMWARQVMGFREALPGVGQDLAGSVLNKLRARKDRAEVAALRTAAMAIDAVHEQMPRWLRAGRTEREVARDIATAIVDAGHATVSFVIVGSGPYAASPHHEPTDRELVEGDVVVVDIGGATHGGYCSDSTRMYAVGQPPAEFLRYYDVLQRAQEAAVMAVRPGVEAQVVDAACRDMITAAGYGDFFIHRTGHGLGLSTHEEPYIVAGNTETIEPGMVFSIEPGIYLPGAHGARIEDVVVCTESGVERLNQVSRELVVL